MLEHVANIGPTVHLRWQQTESRFGQRIRRRLYYLLRARPMHFTDLLRHALNCDPALLRLVLAEDLADRVLRCMNAADGLSIFALARGFPALGAVPHQRALKHRHIHASRSDWASSKEVYSSVEAILNALPEPAPVYSQWWFSRNSYPTLLRLLHRLEPLKTKTVFLGSPTLGALFSQTCRHAVTVLEVDTEVLRCLSSHYSPIASLVPYDANNELDPAFAEEFDLVFADPPWAQRLLALFLRRASELVCVGGVVAISFPQPLTRPGLREEMNDLLGQAHGFGLQLEQRIPDATEYQVPTFERTAYGAAGIRVNAAWRHGDLMLFRKARRNGRGGAVPFDDASFVWRQFRVGKERLFLRRSLDANGRFPLISPVSGASDFVCTTVSSRSDVMRCASIVSTQNEVATTDSYAELARVLPNCLTKIAHAQQRSGLSCHARGLNPIANLDSVLCAEYKSFAGG